MRGKVTSKKLVAANQWLATINANEKELKYIVENDVSYVYLTCYLRSEKIYGKFKRMLISKSKKLIEEGWSIGESRLSYSDNNIFIYAFNSEGVSCVELQFKFTIGKDILNDIEARIDIIQKTIEMFNENIDELKISMDVKYSISREITIPEEKLISILEQLSFEKIYNVKGKYRKFEITNNHNITDQIMVQLFRKHINLDISINVENIVVDSENLSEEILFSSYYYIIEYAQLHYSILKELNNEYLISQQKFYEKLKKAF